ncbi:MAG: M18 family aminopeptidase [Prevotellaceae bacterium]|nr:M18 family aminopeptidase [Prevotellaceae bacterium]
MNKYSKDLLDFLNASPVNFFAVKETARRLEAEGYKRFNAEDRLTSVKAGDKFYVTKNDSSIFAFHIGKKTLGEGGFHIICAHSDSPTFRIKPNAEITCEGGITKLNTEVYGGAILSTWFDRPLSIAGRVIVKGKDAMHPETKLLCVERPILIIPNLAIHFNRQVNDGVSISKQKDMLPILGIVSNTLERGNLLMNVITEQLGINASDILDFDLYLFDTTPACHAGVHDEFISAGRIDDLSMVHAGLSALLADTETIPETTKILGIFDNEETGSQTKQGAGSPFLASIIQRIVLAQGETMDDYHRSIEKAFMISADNAHAWHPNYSEKYDPTNHPMLGGGPVIKFNAAQKYASDAVSAAIFAGICEKAGVPCQRFVNHSDVAGGSTLGNILASSLPLKGVDMGNPIIGMHSVRETGAAIDQEYCIKAFIEFYKN